MESDCCNDTDKSLFPIVLSHSNTSLITFKFNWAGKDCHQANGLRRLGSQLFIDEIIELREKGYSIHQISPSSSDCRALVF